VKSYFQVMKRDEILDYPEQALSAEEVVLLAC